MSPKLAMPLRTCAHRSACPPSMGTGITSILLHELPYQFRGLGIIANIIFALNVLLFLVFLTISM